MEDIKKALPGFFLGLALTIVINLIIFSGNFSRLEAKADAAHELSKNSMPRTEQEAQNRQILERINTVDKKVDSIYVILINKR